MAHEDPIISKIKLPNDEAIYDICDKNAIHKDEAITLEEIDNICGLTVHNAEEVTY